MTSTLARRVTVRVPGSTSNLGAGFDCLGMAVERWVRVTARLDDARGAAPVVMERHGTLRDLEVPPEDDLVYGGFRRACGAAGRDVPPGLMLTADSEVPVSRGLGSSAAALVGGAAVACALLDLDLDRSRLAALCAELDGHPDNVAPAVYGGAVLAVRSASDQLAVRCLDVHESLAWVFAVPDFPVETKRARAALPSSLPHAAGAAAAARSAALVLGLGRADAVLLAAGLDDLLHVPYRRPLVPGFDQVTAAARGAGAYGATLSGSGPTVLALAPRERAAAVGAAMAGAWRGLRVSVETFSMSQQVGGYEVSRD